MCAYDLSRLISIKNKSSLNNEIMNNINLDLRFYNDNCKIDAINPEKTV